MRLPKNRRPTHPGEVFLEDFLIPLGITQKDAAERLRISYPRMNEIVKGKRSVTPDTALRLARFTGTEPEFWLNLQQAVDLWEAIHSDQASELEEIEPAPAMYAEQTLFEKIYSREEDVEVRRRALEAAYNPNDCPEIRWGALPGSAERSTCTTRAPDAQQQRMESMRHGFVKRYACG